MNKSLLIICALLYSLLVSGNTIYKCKDADGNTAFSDQPCADDSSETIIKKNVDESSSDTGQSASGEENQTGNAPSFTVSDLQGKWVITAINGVDDGVHSDIWEFRGNQWIVWTGTTALPADPFTVSDNIIDLDYATKEVTEFSGNSMKTKQYGFIYTFERIP